MARASLGNQVIKKANCKQYRLLMGGQCLGGRWWTGSCRSSDAMFWAGVPCGSTFQGTTAARPLRDNLAAATRKLCAARRSSRHNQAAWLGFPLYYALPWTASSAPSAGGKSGAPATPQTWSYEVRPHSLAAALVMAARQKLLVDDRRAVRANKACEVPSYCLPDTDAPD